MTNRNFATQPTLPSTSRTYTTSDDSLYYNSKWGRVVIFNGDNYATFSTSCRFALTSAGAWDIVHGTEEEPATSNSSATINVRKDYRERRTHGIQIITSSVAESFANRLLPFLDTSDLSGMWTELAKANRANDEVYVANTRYAFANDRFNFTQETIRQYATRLDHFKTMLAGSSRPITDVDILEHILFSLPADQPNWQLAKQWCIREKYDLETALNLLKTHDRCHRCSDR